MMEVQSSITTLIKFYVAENQIFKDQLLKPSLHIVVKYKFHGCISLNLISLVFLLI